MAGYRGGTASQPLWPSRRILEGISRSSPTIWGSGPMDLSPFYSIDIQKNARDRDKPLGSPRGAHMNDPIKKRVFGPALRQVDKYFGTKNQVCSNLTAIETFPGRMPCHVCKKYNGNDNSRYM